MICMIHIERNRPRMVAIGATVEFNLIDLILIPLTHRSVLCTARCFGCVFLRAKQTRFVIAGLVDAFTQHRLVQVPAR